MELKNYLRPTRFFPAIIFVAYATGFVIWNRYLAKFGFFEYNFIQVRYLSAGFLFYTLLSATSVLIYFLTRKLGRKITFPILIAWGFLYLLLGFDAAFQEIPQHWGGAKPVVASIIGTGEQMIYLQNFEVESFSNGGKNQVQTFPLCLLYQNDRYIVLGNGRTAVNKDGTVGVSPGAVRVIVLDRAEFKGFHTNQTPASQLQCRLYLAVLGPKNPIRDYFIRHNKISEEARQVLCGSPQNN